MISFEDFKKIDLRVAKIIKAEKVEGSEKLVKLQVYLGEIGERQILAGISKTYGIEDLIGRQIVVVCNLEPRSLIGNESNGMLLACHDDENNPVLIIPEKSAQNGSVVS